ncbi:MAG TPA: DUF2505 domain-containing protein [Nocardioidaceae bacterium]|nr:DUF2505 domain-containing protein [Nocardioidaceae bacterium]
MKIRHQLTYAAPPTDVYEMRADPAFRARVCEAMDTLRHDVKVHGTDGDLTVSVDMVQQTQGLPSFAKKVVGDETRVIQTERWPSLDAGHIEVEIPGKPGHIRGTLSLAGDGGGSVYVFDGEARINIPLIGGKIEGLIHKMFIAGMDTEQKVAAAWLGGVR